MTIVVIQDANHGEIFQMYMTCGTITPVRILLSQNQTTVQSKRGYLATCRFFHWLELEKVFILLMNFAWIASYKIE